MATLVLPLDRLDEVQAGDRLVAIDDDVLAYRRVFIGGLRHVGPGNNGPLGLPYEYPGVKGWLYPDTMVRRSITVERPEPTPFGRCADCGHRMEADENTCGPCARAERERLDAALAPKKARKPVTRTFNSVRLVSQGGGRWLTEDGRYEIRKGFDGYTFCEGPHPVRITQGLAEAARQNRTQSWAQPILWALRTGKDGYFCSGDEEHENPEAWQVWDLQRGDYVDDLRYDSFEDAAYDLARHLRTQED